MKEEGLQSTENDRIHIGKPIEFDDDEFLKDLEELYQAAYAETDHMKKIVKKIVPTYHLRESDVIRDEKIQAEWKKDFQDASSNLPEAFMNRGVADIEVSNTDAVEKEKQIVNQYQVYMIEDMKRAEGRRRSQVSGKSGR